MSSQPVKKLILNIIPPCSTANSTTPSPLPPPPVYTYLPSGAQMEYRAGPLIHDCGHHNDEESPFSTILFNIISPISIIGDNNIVTIDPMQNAANIANTILRSLKEASTCNAGVAMIDEEGRPRPIEVRVDAGIKVEGGKNIVGEKAVVMGLQADPMKRKRDLRDGNEEAKKGSNKHEVVETGGDAKRQKVQQE